MVTLGSFHDQPGGMAHNPLQAQHSFRRDSRRGDIIVVKSRDTRRGGITVVKPRDTRKGGITVVKSRDTRKGGITAVKSRDTRKGGITAVKSRDDHGQHWSSSCVLTQERTDRRDSS